MRKDYSAPVDSLGAAQQGQKKKDPNTYAYQTLVGLMLSAMTNDATTSKVMNNLKKHGLNINKIYKMKEEEVFELIKGINFNKTKAKNIK